MPFPRGVRDLLPSEALFREELIRRIEDHFRRFGFLAIDTPVFEPLSILLAKDGIGEESKLIYELKGEELALRYDHTVSLARYFSMHKDLPIPFKRYVVGKAWRRDEPQRLRYREFTQADADIIGGRTPEADAEVMAVLALLFDSLGIKYKVLINNRKFVNAMLSSLGLKPAMLAPVTRTIDKLDKIGRDGVLESLRGQNLDKETVQGIDSLISMDGTNAEKIDHMEKLSVDKLTCDDMRETLELLELYGVKGQLSVDFSVVRGLDYYTGIVFEYKMQLGTKSSIGAGGRYDNLIGAMGGRQVPAVGSSLGVDRLLDVLNFSSSQKSTSASVFVACIKDANYKYALKVANTLRSSGVGTDINMATRNISNQLSFANSMKFKYVVVIGDEEEKSGKVKVRNLMDGAESTVGMEDALRIVKEGK